LSETIRDEEAAVDDYLLSRDVAALERYRLAVEDDVRLTEQIRLQAADLPDFATALASVTGES